MQVLFNRSFLSILSVALNFARHWIRSKNPTIQNIDSRRLTGLIALDTSQFHFFLFSPPSSLSHEYNERDVLHNLAPCILYLRSKSSKGKKKRNIVVPEQQRSIDPRFKKKNLNYRQLTRYTTFSLSSTDLVSLFSCTVRAAETHRQIYLFLYPRMASLWWLWWSVSGSSKRAY